MKSPGWTFSAGTVIVLAFVANYFIRVSGSGDLRSKGIIYKFLLKNDALTSILWFVGAIIAIRICCLIYGFIRGLLTPGVFYFWKVVSQNPDDAHYFFLNSDVWEVRCHPLAPNFEEEFPTEQWAGPFDLYVPRIGKRICIFGKAKLYKNSQIDFLDRFKSTQKY